MKPLLKPSDVGLLLGIHVETVKVMARDGRLSGIKIGNRWRFDPSVIERLVASGAANGQPKGYDDEVVQFRLPQKGQSDEPVPTRRRVLGGHRSAGTHASACVDRDDGEERGARVSRSVPRETLA